jgi:sulfoxide reductase heme-binding subunit YedZ
MGAPVFRPVRAKLLAGLLHPGVKPTLFALALLPFLALAWGAYTHQLGANPAETLIRETGDWALRFLCITLAITPMRVVLGLPPLVRLRRMVGLFTYFYGGLHLLTYAWFDMGFDAAEIVRDIAKRPFILVGFLSFLILTPLAATSFNRAVKSLGARRWQALHKSVYLIAGLVLLHFFWMRAGKNDFNEVAAYAAILTVLLGWRFARWWREPRSASAPMRPTLSP